MAFWGRCRVVSVEPGARLHLLSIDYGVTATLPFSHVLPLPHVCKGIPALVSDMYIQCSIIYHVCGPWNLFSRTPSSGHFWLSQMLLFYA